MTLERLRQIEELYHSAREREPNGRGAFLSTACQGDEELRCEVESLLAQDGLNGMMDRPPLQVAADLLTDASMVQVAAGTQLGPYRIEAPLGAGGMGTVYRALDTKLKRPVAIKFLSDELADAAARRRFEQEAKLASSLNHPHILTVYDAGEFEQQQYIVTEFVDGGTLKDWAKEPRSWKQVVELLTGVADGLAAAHAAGILHRDIKPANILVAKNGYAKLADFGLAKLAADVKSDTSVTEGHTRSGVIVGSIPYMSPEQASGKALDARSDIFSFGVVLYEMLVGKLPFRAESELELLKRIVETPAEPLPNEIPLLVRIAVEKALEKDSVERYQSMRDLVVDLRRAARSKPESTREKQNLSRSRVTPAWLWASVAMVCVGLGVAGFLILGPGSQTQLPVRLSLTFEGLTGETDYLTPAPSPDGRNFAFVAVDASGKRSLWIRPLGSETARAVPATEEAERPFWSSDGQWIGFHAQGKLLKASIAGGNPQTIADLRTTSGADAPAWGPKGDIIFSPNNRTPLFRIAESGGAPQPLTKLDASRAENSHRFPVFLPDGRHFLFLARSGRRENNALYLGSLDSGQTRRLMAVQSNVSYVPPRNGRSGSILYVRDGSLMLQAFDGEKVTGEPAAVVEGVAYFPQSVAAGFAVSADGSVLILRPAGQGRDRLTWYARGGMVEGYLGPPGSYADLRFFPDGARLLFSRPDDQTGNRDVWYMETSRGIGARLTTNGANDWFAHPSPDGKKIVFASDRDGGPQNRAYIKNSMEPGTGEQRLMEGVRPSETEDWSHDGKWILFRTGAPADLWVVPAEDGKASFAFLATSFADAMGRFSADDHWIAYNSDESGRWEIYVRPFSGGPAAPTGKIRVSSNGGYFPAWSRDGKELFFLGADLKLYSVNTADFIGANASPQPSPLFTPCSDTVLNSLPLPLNFYDYPYDVTPDGRRFLFNCLAAKPNRLDVMLNWQKFR